MKSCVKFRKPLLWAPGRAALSRRRLLQKVAIPDTTDPSRAGEMRRIDASRGFDVRLGVEQEDISSCRFPIDLRGIGIEQPEVSDEVNSIIVREGVTAGRSRGQSCLRPVGHRAVDPTGPSGHVAYRYIL